jgi:segregation and condensation protein B
LAIIAYRQPVAKADIEFIRGVNVDGVISNLLEKGMVRITGRKEVVGRPFLYGTTNQFLQYFGLNSLDELPALPEFKEADLNFQKKDNITIEPAQELAQELPLDDKTPTNNGGIRDGESKEVTP